MSNSKTDAGIRNLTLAGRAPILRSTPDFGTISGPCLIDLQDLAFATPLDLVGLASLVSSAPPESRIRLRPPADPLVANYLRRMDLLPILAPRVTVEPEFALETPREQTPGLIELRHIASAAEVGSVNDRLFAELERVLPYPSHRAVFEIIAELLENASSHGASASGAYLAAQFYTGRTSGMPRGFWIAVADAGIGVRAHLGQNPAFRQLDDADAIRVASQLGVSGTNDAGRGLGLKDIRSRAGHSSGGQVVTLSGRGEGHFFVGPHGATARYRTRPTAICGTWTLALAGTTKPHNRT